MVHSGSLFNVSVEDQLDDGVAIVVTAMMQPPPSPGALVEFMAAAPPDRRASFSGSGLPFPNAAAAFYATPNRGTVRAGPMGEVRIRLPARPGSYYAGLGTALVPPTLHVAWRVGDASRTAVVQLGAPLPHRSLTYPRARSGPLFYDPPRPVDQRTQESILRASGYGVGVAPGALTTGAPDAAGFWGGRPPR